MNQISKPSDPAIKEVSKPGDAGHGITSKTKIDSLGTVIQELNKYKGDRLAIAQILSTAAAFFDVEMEVR